jgi:TRAP-type C4-dicarboxylate transport system permease small subunit
MGFLNLAIRRIIDVNKWISYWVLVLMMIFVGVAALSRGIGFPIIGDVELVQFAMVMTIVGSLAYTEHTNSHIAIGIIVDRFPEKVQMVFDIIAQIFVIFFSLIVAYVFIIKLDFVQASTLLRIPFYPFKILLIIGFVSWGIVALKKLMDAIVSLTKSAE